MSHACTGIIWADDAAIVRFGPEPPEKVYGEQIGCLITVTPLALAGDCAAPADVAAPPAHQASEGGQLFTERTVTV